MLTTPLAFLPAWAWRVLGYGLLAIALFAFGWVEGDEHGTEKLTEYIGKQATESAKVVVRQGEITHSIETVYVTDVEKIHDQVQKTQAAVKTFLMDTHLELPGSFRVLHDAAASGAVPDAASVPDAAPADLETVAATVIENYGAARLNAEQLVQLQSWVAKNWAIDHPNQKAPWLETAPASPAGSTASHTGDSPPVTTEK